MTSPMLYRPSSARDNSPSSPMASALPGSAINAPHFTQDSAPGSTGAKHVGQLRLEGGSVIAEQIVRVRSGQQTALPWETDEAPRVCQIRGSMTPWALRLVLPATGTSVLVSGAPGLDLSASAQKGSRV